MNGVGVSIVIAIIASGVWGFLCGILFWEFRTRRMINRTFEMFGHKYTIRRTPRTFTLSHEYNEPLSPVADQFHEDAY